MAKLKKEGAHHGAVELVFPDGGPVVAGRGVFIVKDGTLYATFPNGKDIPHQVERGYRLKFKIDGGGVLVSKGGYDGYITEPWANKNNSRQFHFDEYFECEDEKQADEIIKNGISGVRVFLSGVRSDCKASLGSSFKEARTEIIGKFQDLDRKEYDDGVGIVAQETFNFIGKDMTVNNALIISYTNGSVQLSSD